MSETVDLTKFARDIDGTRPYLAKPFSAGDFTYATNGHILVRVPRIESTKEIEKKGHWDKPLEGYETAEYEPASLNLPPRAETLEECERCEGSGKDHDCPECCCLCRRCDGFGFEDPDRDEKFKIGGLPFALRYVRLMAALPGLEIMKSPVYAAPLLFRFDGGIGAVMGLRS